VTKTFRYWKLPAILWAVFILILTSWPTLTPPPLGFEAQDKVYHFAAYLVFGLLLVRALSEGKMTHYPMDALLTATIGILFGIFDELHQSFIPGRSCDIFDAAADAVGILLALLVYRLLKNKFSLFLRC
jgi:VanZ family protein